MTTKIPKDIQAEVDKRISQLLGFSDERNIFTHDEQKGILFIGGERIDESRLANLKSEAEFILSSDLWVIISETIKHMAEDRMFVKSRTYEDLISGKMWLYHVDIQKKIMNKFSNYKKPTPISPPTQLR